MIACSASPGVPSIPSTKMGLLSVSGLHGLNSQFIEMLVPSLRASSVKSAPVLAAAGGTSTWRDDLRLFASCICDIIPLTRVKFNGTWEVKPKT